MANDNDFSTRWNSLAGDTDGAWLELDWPSAIRFNRATLAQFSSRITSYKILHWSRSGWSDDFSGGQSGAAASDSFPTVDSSKARFLSVTATNVPSMYGFQIFEDLPVAPPAATRINEWMLNNTRTRRNPAEGKFEPRFELYNAGTTSVNLAGWSLAGSLAGLSPFQIICKIQYGQLGRLFLPTASGD